MEIEEIKRLVHDAMVLDYIMDQCGFIRMRVYEAPHKWNKFKVKLYKSVFVSWNGIGKHGSLMTYGLDSKFHVFVTSNISFKNAKDINICFSTTNVLCEIQAKAALLQVLKDSNGFKIQDEEHMIDKIDEMVVKADLDVWSRIDEEQAIVSILDNILNNEIPF